jgi:tetratricopeptide (TPR) repeat protein
VFSVDAGSLSVRQHTPDAARRVDNVRMKQRPTASCPRVRVLLVSALLTAGCGSSGSGLTVSRLAPARSSLGAARSLAIIDARYPEARQAAPVATTSNESYSARISRMLVMDLSAGDIFQVVDARKLGVRPAEVGHDAGRTAILLQAAPADAYLGIRLLGCAAPLMSATEQRGSGSGSVSVTVYWYQGECVAEMTALDREGKTIATVQQTGRWESSRQDRAEGGAIQETALNNAIDDAAKRLAAEIKPRRVKEAVPLDAAAPLAAEGLREIDAGQLAAARSLWEGALAANPSSAGLRYNLGAVCEALGDVDAARKSYQDALALAPSDEKVKKGLGRLGAPGAGPNKS